MKKLFLLIALATLLLPVMSQTILGDSIMSDSTLSKAMSPYLLTDSFYLDTSVTLTLEAGVTVQFDTFRRFKFNGSIHALGTTTDSVTFLQKGRDYVTIVFASTDTNYFQHCNFSLYADTIGSQRGHTNININTTGTYFFDDCTFSTPKGSLYRRSGYYIKKAKCEFRNCRFDNVYMNINFNSFWGRSIASHSPGYFTNCTFESGYIRTEKSTFSNCYFKEGYIDFKSAEVFEYCTFENYRSTLFPYAMGPVPAIPNQARYDTVVFRHNYFFNPDTSRAIYIFGMFYFGTLDDQGLRDSVGIYPPLKFNYNEVCVRGGIPMDSLFQGWDLRHNCWCETDTQAILNRFPNDSSYHYFTGPFITANDIIPFNSNCIAEVFPGDANYDHEANMRDLLPLGLRYGNTGPARVNASLVWIGQDATNWTTSSPKGLNDKHADCNGDGTINASDTLAIFQNYTLTHPVFKSNGNGIPLTVTPTLPANSYKTGDTVIYNIAWGDLDSTVQNAYGVTLSLQYDTSQWKSSSLRVLQPSSWLGTPSTDMLTMVYHDSIHGRLDIGWVRTDGMTRNGFGQIGSIVIVLDDDISKRQVPVRWEVLDAYAIDPQEDEIELDPTVETLFLDVSTSIEPENARLLQVYPNPSQDGYFNIDLESHGGGELVVFDVLGKIIRSQTISPSTRSASINLQDQPSGMYTLRFSSNTMRASKRLFKVY